MRKIYIIIILLHTLVSCKTTKTGTQPLPLITMQRTPCFGTCAIYTISIATDGKMEYIGERFVDKVGIYQKKLSKSELSKIETAFIKSNFFDYQDAYTADMTDLPTTYISFTHKGKTKKITDYYNSPQSLLKLEKIIDSVSNTTDWKKVSDLPK